MTAPLDLAAVKKYLDDCDYYGETSPKETAAFIRPLVRECSRLAAENARLRSVRDAAAEVVEKWEPKYPQDYEPKGPMIDGLKAALRAAEWGG